MCGEGFMTMLALLVCVDFFGHDGERMDDA